MGSVYKFEPILALDGGEDGLKIIDRLLRQAKTLLLPGGLILLEIESSQGESAQQLARRYFPQSKIRLVSDLAIIPACCQFNPDRNFLACRTSNRAFLPSSAPLPSGDQPLLSPNF